jgi:hypothetical protein
MKQDLFFLLIVVVKSQLATPFASLSSIALENYYVFLRIFFSSKEIFLISSDRLPFPIFPLNLLQLMNLLPTVKVSSTYHFVFKKTGVCL